MNYYQDKIIWLTGASSGIGEALAIQLAQKGAKLILSARRENELQRVAQLCASPPENIYILPLDLENYTYLPIIVEKALNHFGKIDILINNAGVSQRSLAKDTNIEVFKKLMDIDYLGTVALTKALLPHFLEQKSGHIVTVTSLMGVFSSPLRSGYAAAKHALHGFFDALRAETHQEGLIISLVCPGFVQTNVSMNALTGTGKQQGTMDDATAKGLTTTVFSERMLKAVAKQKAEVYIGGREVVGIYLKRFFPALLRKWLQTAKVV